MSHEYNDRLFSYNFTSELEISTLHQEISKALCSPSERVNKSEILKIDTKNNSIIRIQSDYMKNIKCTSLPRPPYLSITLGDPAYIQYNQEKVKFYRLLIHIVDYDHTKNNNEPTHYTNMLNLIGTQVDDALICLHKADKVNYNKSYTTRFLSKSERIVLKI